MSNSPAGLTEPKVEVIHLERGERYAGANEPLQPYVRNSLGGVVYAPWDQAEPECKRRALEALLSRVNVPDGVAFVRTWEVVPPVVQPFSPPTDIQNVGTSPATTDVSAQPKRSRARR